MTVVLDASALLAMAQHEPGADVVADAIPDSVIGSVNYSEVVARLADDGASETGIAVFVNSLRLTVIPFTEDQAFVAGLLRPITKSRGLSLGDRACLALGMRLGYRVLTADRAWDGLDVGVEIALVR